LAWLAIVGLAVGCNRSGMDLAPVEGVVTFDGAPVGNAGVMFVPDRGAMAVGITDAEGKFTLKTANYPGALIGGHRVSISKDETTAIPQRRGFPLYKITNYIPAKYADPALSGLTADVQDDDNHFEFKLEKE
jgi:hypothetical protein